MSDEQTFSFPVDDVTLAMLQAACAADPADGRSHLFDFLDFGALENTRTEIGPATFEVTYEPGRAPWSVHEVITALILEIQRLRGAITIDHGDTEATRGEVEPT